MNLSDANERTKLVSLIQNDIDAFCKIEFADDPRTHLGASIIGNSCLAYSWNTFRWLRFEDFSGQMLRLFNRGHEEEKRFVRWLRGIGFEVREFDPLTGKQYRIIGSKGHFGGSLDGMAKAPERYGIADAMLVEFKTHNEKSFTKLAGKKPNWRDMGTPRTGGQGVRVSKPVHWRQMNSYGKARELKYGLYCAANKDTDELYFEIVELDWREADDLYRKADTIVFSQTRPQKIAMTKEFSDCKICDFANLCHGDEMPTKNCRSCRHASPIENAEWWCAVNSPRNDNLPIPHSTIVQGCDSWSRIA